jgi:hypothetical protein
VSSAKDAMLADEPYLVGDPELDADERPTGLELASPIGAGSVVTRDMPAHHLCLGSPCRPIRPI